MAARPLVEHRFLEGPNLYFRRPAVKVTLDISGVEELSREAAAELGRAVGLRAPRPGPAGSAFRGHYALRLLVAVVRRVAARGGSHRIAVRVRPGTDRRHAIVAVPWRFGGRVEAFAGGLGDVLAAVGGGPDALLAAIAAAGDAIAAAPEGRRPTVVRTRVPVAMITGTNGKTTTSRMLGAIARAQGLDVGWSSTEGVYHNGRLIRSGDYSGPGGARLILAQPGVQVAVCETARGGIVQRGLGIAANDVAVVTNVTVDHLGQDGVETLDDLAEVKSVIVQVTKPSGWCVLNADDPRVFAMRAVSPARCWAFSRDPDSPGVRTVLNEGGRGSVIMDGWITVLQAGADPLPVVALADLPMTLYGLSGANVENALAAASAALALGWSADAVARGLAGFRPDQSSSGRMNIGTLEGRTIVIDMAHNVAGLEAMLEVCAGLRRDGGRLLIGVGSGADRGPETLTKIGELGALAADVVDVKVCDHYLRGRPASYMIDLVTAGVERAGKRVEATFDEELPCLVHLVEVSEPGDVVAMMTHQDNARIDAWLAERGGSWDTPEVLRAKVLGD